MINEIKENNIKWEPDKKFGKRVHLGIRILIFSFSEIKIYDIDDSKRELHYI